MTRTWAIGPIAALLITFGGCDDNAGTGDPGRVSIALTDAPGDFVQATVEIERVELAGSDGVVTLRDTPIVTNLLTLANDFTMLVDEATVPAGRYDQIRFIIPSACIEVVAEDESTRVYASSGMDACGAPDGPLQLPSFGETGLKVVLPDGGLEIDGNEWTVLVDFDVAESFGQQAGGSGMWVMHPVVHASILEQSGSITVELTSASPGDGGSPGDFQARLDTEPVALPLEDPDADGVFQATFEYLIPGPHVVSVELHEGLSYDFTLSPTSPQVVMLDPGEQETVVFQITAATP